MKYKILDIKSAETGKTRTDGRYPLRIGSIVSPHIIEMWEGVRLAALEYHKDNQGNDKEGVLRTSLVQEIEIFDTMMIIYTLNSIYYLEVIENDDNGKIN